MVRLCAWDREERLDKRTCFDRIESGSTPRGCIPWVETKGMTTYPDDHVGRNTLQGNRLHCAGCAVNLSRIDTTNLICYYCSVGSLCVSAVLGDPNWASDRGRRQTGLIGLIQTDVKEIKTLRTIP